MGSIKATFSAIDIYASNCSEDYIVMINMANEILTNVEKLHIDVLEDYEKISMQIYQLQEMYEEVNLKVKSYEQKNGEAAAKVERLQKEIDYLYSHPNIIITEDEDGNETTEKVYDYEAINIASKERDKAKEMYYLYKEKHDAAYELLIETKNMQSRFQTIKNAIYAVSESIQSDIHEIKKYLIAINDEVEYNTHHLRGVLGSLSAYLSSKAIFIPNIARHENIQYFGEGSVHAQLNSYDNDLHKNEITLSEKEDLNISFDDLPKDTPANIINSIVYDTAVKVGTVSQRKFQKQSKNDVKKLNYNECRTIKNYCSDNGFPPIYKKINSYLRGNSSEILPHLKDDINIMTEAISKCTLTQSTTVYRALNNSQSMFGDNENLSIDELNKIYVGQNFIDKGFCSTSISERGIEEFLSWNSVILEIEAPVGAQAIFTGELSNYQEKEQEILFQRGSIFRINNISEVNGSKHVNLTLTGRISL